MAEEIYQPFMTSYLAEVSGATDARAYDWMILDGGAQMSEERVMMVKDTVTPLREAVESLQTSAAHCVYVTKVIDGKTVEYTTFSFDGGKKAFTVVSIDGVVLSTCDWYDISNYKFAPTDLPKEGT